LSSGLDTEPVSLYQQESPEIPGFFI
jgi:hypothetical protein